MSLNDEEDVECEICDGYGFIVTEQQAEYRWNSEENLLEVDLEITGSVPCPTCCHLAD